MGKRIYIKGLKMLDDLQSIKIPLSEVKDIPDEVWRMIKAEYHIAFSKSGKFCSCWAIVSDVEEFDVFSGQYAIGKDKIGIYWERRKPGTHPQW